MDALGAIITVGISIIAIAMLAMVTGSVLGALPEFQSNTTWAPIMEGITETSGTAFSLISIAPLVLGASVIIAIIIGAFAVTR
jgi:hypothetical protein